MRNIIFTTMLCGFVSMQTMCEAKSNLKNIAKVYKGAGVATYLKKPFFFASEGVRVDFEKFSLLNGFDKELLIAGLPKLSNTYSIYFSPDIHRVLGEDITSKISIVMTLKNRSGEVLWSVNTRLASWNETQMQYNGETKAVYYYFHKEGSYKDKIGRLDPDEGMNYTLQIRCWINEDQRETVDVEGHFFLRAGGYK